MQSKMDAKAGNDANGLTDPRLIGSRRINKGQRSWTESHEGLYGVSKNVICYT
ncbi:hypothetical protein Hdeb2414_s0015g00452841 [Helianthus debilis subsp. tardiflorus]